MSIKELTIVHTCIQNQYIQWTWVAKGTSWWKIWQIEHLSMLCLFKWGPMYDSWHGLGTDLLYEIKQLLSSSSWHTGCNLLILCVNIQCANVCVYMMMIRCCEI